MQGYNAIEQLKTLRHLVTLVFEDESELYRGGLTAFLMPETGGDAMPLPITDRAQFNRLLTVLDDGFDFLFFQNRVGRVDLPELINTHLSQLAHPVNLNFEQLQQLFEPVAIYNLQISTQYPFVYDVFFKHPLSVMDTISVDGIAGVEYGHKVLMYIDNHATEQQDLVERRSFVLTSLVALRNEF